MRTESDCLTVRMAELTRSVRLETEGNVALIVVDNPPVNALSWHVRQGLFDGMTQAVETGAQAIVVICDGRTFIAGADISEFGGSAPDAAGLPQVQAAMEDAPVPVIAAIHGTALGGGLEVALCAHYRVSVASAKFGLPEVNLGLLPGAGGTQRLPRLTGVPKALEMMTSGRHIGTAEALECGLVDEVVDGGLDELRTAAIEFARRAAAEGMVARQGPRPERQGARGPRRRTALRRLQGVDRPQGAWLPGSRVQHPVHRGGRQPAVRRGPEGRAQAVHGADDRPAIGRAALLLLRRASGQQDPRHPEGHAADRHREGRASSAPARWAAGSR